MQLTHKTSLVKRANVSVHLVQHNIVYTFATERDCCSMASCMVVLSCSLIEPNSSIQHTPPSANTSAPASNVQVPPLSFIAVTVRPAPVVPTPVVSTDLLAILAANLSN